MHALDPVQYSYNAEYLSAVTRTVGFYNHLYVALNVWANVWAETSYNCISVNFYLCAKQRTPKCVRRRVDHDRHQKFMQRRTGSEVIARASLVSKSGTYL